MSLTLAFDTTSEACSVALNDGDETLSEEREMRTHGHAAVLVPMIERVLKRAGVSPSTIRTVGVTVGPGSFTGIRTGLAAAKGLVLATGARPVGLSSLWAVAWRALEDSGYRSPVLCVLDTRRSDCFVQKFGVDGVPEAEPMIATIQELCEQLANTPCVVTGNAVPALVSACPDLASDLSIHPGDVIPNAADIARLANRTPVDDTVTDHGLCPLYLRRAATTSPRPHTVAPA